jgi:hypothetical protein
MAGGPASASLVCETYYVNSGASPIFFVDLKAKCADSAAAEMLTASHCLFHRFMASVNLRKIKVSGEAVNADTAVWEVH